MTTPRLNRRIRACGHGPTAWAAAIFSAVPLATGARADVPCPLTDIFVAPPPVASFDVGRYAAAIAAADLDGDGALDLVTANADSDDLSVLLAIGGGEFAPEIRLAVGNAPAALAVADIDADGILDLVTNDFELGSGARAPGTRRRDVRPGGAGRCGRRGLLPRGDGS